MQPITQQPQIQKQQRTQNIFIENRKLASITGVQDVVRFNDDIIVMKTEFGQLQIKGSNLRITKLDIDNGMIEIAGVISAADYTGKGKGLGKFQGVGGSK